MLRPERAKEVLESLQDNNWINNRIADAFSLTGEQHKAALALMGYTDGAKPETPVYGYGPGVWQRVYKAQEDAMKFLEKAGSVGRMAIFSILFPKFARYVEDGWQLMARLPYQSHYERKAFRASEAPSALRQARLRWLTTLISVTGPYNHDLAWFAAWAPHLGWNANALGILFAAAIESGSKEGEEVYEILTASARGEHEIGAMGRHVVRALLVASRPGGWDFMERMLLAAQREEGLRQTILETVDEAHPEAFRRILRIIKDHDLARFPATVRAVNVWFGYAWDSASVRVVNEIIAKVLMFLDDPFAISRTLSDGEADAETSYLALWALAFDNALDAIPAAAALLQDSRVERRFVGAHMLGQLRLPEAYRALLPALDDADLRVVVRAFMALAEYGVNSEVSDLFERFERVMPRLPEKPKQLEPLVWPWMALTADRQQVASALLQNLSSRSPMRLLPYVSAMESWDRRKMAETLAKSAKSDAAARDTLLMLVGDPSSWVREAALKAVAKFEITEEEARRLEKMMTRKAGDLRRGVLSLLLNQGDEPALTSAQRLLGASDRMQRAAGVEMLHEMVKAKRAIEQCQQLAAAYKEKRPARAVDEERMLDTILGSATARKEWTLDDGLGLFDKRELSRPQKPPQSLLDKLFKKPMVTPAALACIRSLDALVEKHGTTPIKLADWQGEREELLANATYGLPAPEKGVPVEADVARLPLREVWEAWYSERAKEMRDADGLELLRALAALHRGTDTVYARYHSGHEERPAEWEQRAVQILFGNYNKLKLRYPQIVSTVLTWLLKLYPPQGAVDLLLEGIEASIGLIPRDKIAEGLGGAFVYLRGNSGLLGWIDLARYHRTHYPSQWNASQQIHLWKLMQWIAAIKKQGYQLELDVLLAAYQAGGATEADILNHLIGARPKRAETWGYSGYYVRWEFGDLHRLSKRKMPAEYDNYPILPALVERCRQRIIEVELERGDMPTAASSATFALRWSGGLRNLVRLLKAMGRESFVRGWSYDSLSKAAVFSHLIRSTFPGESDTHEAFATEIESAGIPQKRLIELAMYAPQWANHVEHALGWPGLAEGVWWIHAHTKDTSWTVDQEIREVWAAQVSERTPLAGQNLLDGAVDVAWFGRVYDLLGHERWEALYGAGAYAAGGGGHKRALLFADAMLGKVASEELASRINEKRNQDALRALGLLPLPGKGAEREKDILERYKIVQEFRRTSRKFGPQRQASEKVAATIAMENLARTAGYPDPVRLEWAMEAQAIEDLAAGPLTATVGDVTLCLAVNEWGEPDLTLTKGVRPLKAIPPKVKKDPQVVELKEREREVKRQASRMRRSLEGAMCRGDEFSGAELRALFGHPVLRPMIERLVFLGEDIAGYPVEEGLALRSHSGKLQPVGKSELLRIAHPHDLMVGGKWHLWQRDLFAMERVQPFKQAFRELYLLTSTEREDKNSSRRYAGHQVQPRQALALLGSRGWVSHPEEGVRRTFHDAGISAWVQFMEGFYTPAEVDGLTLDNVRFTKRGDWKPLDLAAVPPRVFSEAMRDLDLVVSVAHRGGVDPEASASTVEMRASLVRETCDMLGLGNVRLQGAHALVEGELGHYSVHLGSATVHRQPGGALCILPVHSQHRGRIFLPFADDDPKTAEVLSKVILLARDTQIKDPSILEQIFAMG